MKALRMEIWRYVVKLFSDKNCRIEFGSDISIKRSGIGVVWRGRGRTDEVWNDHLDAYFKKIKKKKKTSYSKKVSICQRYESWASRRAPSPITHLCSQTYARAQIQLPRLVLLYFLQQLLQYYESSDAFCFFLFVFFPLGSVSTVQWNLTGM